MNEREIEDRLKVLENRTLANVKSILDLRNNLEEVKRNE
jgi:hypothetical protein